MKKISINQSILNQIKNNKVNSYTQVNSKNLYVSNFFANDTLKIYSYNTQIATYNNIKNILYITQKKYSITTTKQQNQIKNNFIKYCNSKIVYTSEI